MNQDSAAQYPYRLLSGQSERYEHEVAVVRGLIFALQPYPLIVVATPNSKFAAHLFATMYERRFGVLTRCCGIDEMVRSLPFLTSNAVFILGIEPETPAIIAGLESCLAYEPRKIGVLCRENTRLGRIARSANGVAWAEINCPDVPSDGAVELATVLECAFFGPWRTAKVAQIATTAVGWTDARPAIEAIMEGATSTILRRDRLLVLYSYDTAAAAELLRTQIFQGSSSSVELGTIEDALCAADRWLQERPYETGVLVLSDADNTADVGGLRETLPAGVAYAEVLFSEVGRRLGVAALVYAKLFAEARQATLGVLQKKRHADRRVRESDGGRPSAPIEWRVAAIRRKARALGVSIQADEISSSFLRSLDDEVQKLNGQEFRALIVDYDGTLWCPPEEGRVTDVLARLEPLLRSGIVIGIATGRDARLASELSRVFDFRLRENIWLGSANGTKVGRLDPSGACDELCSELQPLKAALESDPILRHVATLVCSQRQLTIVARRLFSSDALWRIAHTYARRSGVRGIQVVTSTHSVDILAPGATKLSLFDTFRTLGIRRDQVLCIGDQGRWPGNDFDLLEHDFALSVDEPSPCWSCGWNLAPPGCRGPAATLFYLQHTIPATQGYFHLNLTVE